MRNATRPRTRSSGEHLLAIDPLSGVFREGPFSGLSDRLRAPDLLVVNDAATLPASLPVHVDGSNADILELRLAGEGEDDATWWAVLFGRGSWRVATEHRPPPPRLRPGITLRIGEDLSARVEATAPLSPRLLRIRFDRAGEALYAALYRHGRPVQYSYLETDLALWDVQTRFGGRPWAVEMPSAGRPLTWDLLLTLRRKGVSMARVTHAAGLSATGDPELDPHLPLPERYEIPEATVRALEAAQRDGGRVIAVGTSTVRALEGSAAAHGGWVTAGRGTTDLRLGPGTGRQVVDGLLTGMHEAGSSHFALMEAFAPRKALDPALAHADRQGFLQHEFGDSVLILPPGPRSLLVAAA